MGLAELMSGIGQCVPPRVLAERIETIRHSDGAVLVAMEWGPPSGVVALSWRVDLQAEAAEAQITTLLVREDARRRGVGRLLLKAAARTARTAGCSALQLLAPPDHPDLEGFCLATGFARTTIGFGRGLRKRA